MQKVTQKVIQNLQLLIYHQMRPYSRHSVGQIIPVYQVLKYCGNLRKLGLLPQIMCRDT